MDADAGHVDGSCLGETANDYYCWSQKTGCHCITLDKGTEKARPTAAGFFVFSPFLSPYPSSFESLISYFVASVAI